MPNPTAFPADLAACHAMLAEKDYLIEQLTDRVEGQKEELAKVAAERDAALQLAFRKKQERHIADPNQFVLDFGESADVQDFAEGIAAAADEHEGETVDGYTRRKKGSGRRRNEQLPEHLPRYEVTLDVLEDKKTCPIHGDRKVIGHDWQETLEVVPAKLIVRRTGIPKLACPADSACGVVEADRPVGLVEGNRYGPSVAAEVITSKYGYHIPVYRQQDIFATCGWTPARSTLQNVLKAAWQLFRPLVESFSGLVRAGPGEAIHSESGGQFTRAACLAHARRKVFEACDNPPVHTSVLLAWFKQLYDIEDRGNQLTPADRQALRDAEARPLWSQISDYIHGDAVRNVLPKEQFGTALGYLRNHEQLFLTYLDDGLVPIDNNDTEQLMKQVATGRKNWQVIGSVEAGYRAADLMTPVSSDARNELDVSIYLADMLDRLLTGDTDFHSMRPDV
jgi:transposase